jgi:hypothetical protein
MEITQRVRSAIAPRARLALRVAACAATAAIVGACAGTPPPTAQITAAQQAIEDAERARAAELASAELSQARSKLAAANTAVGTGDMDAALRYAEEASVDAELAAARAAVAKAQAANEEIRASTRVLVEELDRKTEGTP